MNLGGMTYNLFSYEISPVRDEIFITNKNHQNFMNLGGMTYNLFSYEVSPGRDEIFITNKNHQNFINPVRRYV
jgi:hypothetical protein